MKSKLNYVCAALALAAIGGGLYGCNDKSQDEKVSDAVNNIQNVVVIYAENRSFDNLYSDFPGLDNPLADAIKNGKVALQVDRDGKTQLSRFPQVINGGSGGLTQPAASQFDASVAQVSRATTDTVFASLGAVPYFSINDKFGMGLNGVNADMYHRFYENQMQIDGGKNDQFAAWADSGGMVMGLFTGNASKLPLWAVAQKYTLADHWFQGAFGGSYLNHQYLIASAAPVNKATDPNKPALSKLDDGDQGYHLTVDTTKTPASAIGGIPTFVASTATTPDGYSINTMQPPYQPSSNATAAGGAATLANPATASTLPPQTGDTIGDYLTKANVNWAYYGGGWGTMLNCKVNGTTCPSSSGAYLADGVTPYINFQFHHQPFNYYKNFDPTTDAGKANRAAHLLDGGDAGEKFIADIDAGKLPPVAFYKPVGDLNEHNGYADVLRGDKHIADIISHLEKSPQWKNMLVVVTYDENGGIWDHVAPPKGDRFGPGSRIPAIIAGPTVKTNNVDHTMYDTTSILRFITKRWSLPTLPGLQTRIDGLTKNAGAPQGDLTNALQLED